MHQLLNRLYGPGWFWSRELLPLEARTRAHNSGVAPSSEQRPVQCRDASLHYRFLAACQLGCAAHALERVLGVRAGGLLAQARLQDVLGRPARLLRRCTADIRCALRQLPCRFRFS